MSQRFHRGTPDTCTAWSPLVLPKKIYYNITLPLFTSAASHDGGRFNCRYLCFRSSIIVLFDKSSSNRLNIVRKIQVFVIRTVVFLLNLMSFLLDIILITLKRIRNVNVKFLTIIDFLGD